MWNILIFAVIGLLTGAAARLLYPGRDAIHVAATILFGVIGAVVGGVISTNWWPAVDGEFHTGNLVLAVGGAVAVIAIWAGVAYKRSLRA